MSNVKSHTLVVSAVESAISIGYHVTITCRDRKRKIVIDTYRSQLHHCCLRSHLDHHTASVIQCTNRCHSGIATADNLQLASQLTSIISDSKIPHHTHKRHKICCHTTYNTRNQREAELSVILLSIQTKVLLVDSKDVQNIPLRFLSRMH